MRSELALRAGIRVNPAKTEWKRPLRHIAQFLMRNVGLLNNDNFSYTIYRTALL